MLFQKSRTNAAFDVGNHEPLYTFPLLVTECCSHEQKPNHFSQQETKKKYYHHKITLKAL